VRLLCPKTNRMLKMILDKFVFFYGFLIGVSDDSMQNVIRLATWKRCCQTCRHTFQPPFTRLHPLHRHGLAVILHGNRKTCI
jgi:hypothetical protein